MADPSFSGAVGKPAAGFPRLAIVYKNVSDLKPNTRNPKIHSKKQIRQVADSIRQFGFNVPILTDAAGSIIAGHARCEAAKLLGISAVPTISLEDLTEAQARAFMIADNRLCEIAEWDNQLLAQDFKELSVLDLGFSLETTGFETAEIDLFIGGLSPAIQGPDPADRVPESAAAAPVTEPGDLWLLGHHRVCCGDARDADSFTRLMEARLATLVFSDPPYNVAIDGHASGKGAVKHPDFVMASGEMSKAEFTQFLAQSFALLAKHSTDGAVAYVCMDWRHIQEVLTAGEEAFSGLKNLCVWAKDRAGMGSFYRSQHELIFVFKTGTAPHINNIQLGQFGRYRTNVWQYPSAVSFGGGDEEGGLLALHPTVKPVAMVADAIMDCSRRGDVVLDSFLGSGSTVIAAERTGRICYGLELDPKYVDVIIRRWQDFTRNEARHATSGRAFNEIAKEVENGQR